MSTASETNMASTIREIQSLKGSVARTNIAYAIDQKLLDDLMSIQWPKMESITFEADTPIRFRSGFDFGVPASLFGSQIYVIPRERLIEPEDKPPVQWSEPVVAEPTSVWQVFVIVVVGCWIFCTLAGAM